ncbi:MAG: hypothetical protein D6730_21695 [Bacteroidetes bacterium]|nr:MAG: hypothetical protein D6730_21695 [Bacteroidota bacterium]
MHTISVVQVLLETSEHPEARRAYLPELLENLNAFEESEELMYWSMLLLLEMNEADIVRAYLLPFLQAHPYCQWAWALMGISFLELEPELALACSCKACCLEADSRFYTDTERGMILGLLLTGSPFTVPFLPKHFVEHGSWLAESVFDFPHQQYTPTVEVRI